MKKELEMTDFQPLSEMELLQSMWKQPIRRVTELIVPRVTFDLMDGSLNNKSWFFRVPYAFRDALDIKYEQRIKEKMPYMLWTQGPLLSFSSGDTFKSADGLSALQIDEGTPMAWDTENGVMSLGSVLFKCFSIEDFRYSLKETKNLNQMDFLDLLINGAKG